MTTRLALLATGMVLAASYPGAPRAADDGRTVGRVRVTTVREATSSRAESVASALATRFAPAPGNRFAELRVVSVRPRPDEEARFDATIYDYTVEQAYDLVLDVKGRELSRKTITGQPARSRNELADAETIVRESAPFAPSVSQGTIVVYEPMPAVTVDPDGRRLVNVGVMSRALAGQSLAKNEIVSVHIPTGTVVRYPSGAPETSRAALLACGPATSGCSYATGPCSDYQILWPAADPVWKLNIRHPSCTQSVQGDGTGLELTDVYYRGRLILKRAEVPVLNVLYAGNSCGPYRDWLDAEDCFQATGTDVPSGGSGIRVASAAPSTLCETESDAGNFKGVAIFDQGDALWLMTETNAGWYRYVMEWRLHLDGTIEPIFGFGATSNSCTCNAHAHHAYWRLEWAIDALSDGTTDDPATGIATIERRLAGTQDEYVPIATEGTFVRPVTGGNLDSWRIRNPSTGNGFILEPGSLDGNAVGDSYGKWDLAALALNPGEIDDPNANTSINIDPWVGGESLGAAKRLVTWYHATFSHDDPNGTGEACELAGPRLVPLVPCAGSLFVDRAAYACNASIVVTLTDSDLEGDGSAAVTVTSATEATPEPLTLTETPAGSGRFQGVIDTSPDAPAAGDGKIGVFDGDTIAVHYIDASSCGSPDVAVDEPASIDCVAPSLSNVHATPGNTFATITWNTSEMSSSVVHYGPSLPTALSASTTGTASTHAVSLTGLAECTTYYYGVESTDGAGNSVFSNAGGGAFAFTTGQHHDATLASTDTPIAIPDNSAAGAISTIAATDTSIVQHVDVTVNVTHTFDGNLTLSLITPAGTTIPLALRRGASGDNYTDTVFDDEASTTIASGTAPFTGSFRPENPLSLADGLSGAGNWRFRVLDVAGQNIGTMDDWSLGLSYAPIACVPVGFPPPVPDGSFGVAMTASRASGDGSIVRLDWDAAICAAANSHLLYGVLQNVASHLPDGGVCGLGPLGSYDWSAVPTGDLWFLVVSDDAASTEGSWGVDGGGGERNGTSASGSCGFTARSNSGACP